MTLHDRITDAARTLLTIEHHVCLSDNWQADRAEELRLAAVWVDNAVAQLQQLARALRDEARPR
jgi:hypothetical protein